MGAALVPPFSKLELRRHLHSNLELGNEDKFGRRLSCSRIVWRCRGGLLNIKPMRYVSLGAALFACVLRAAAAAETPTPTPWPDEYIVHHHSTSPNGELGILIPNADLADADDAANYVANLKTHEILGKIEGAEYFERQNHRDLNVTWAPDSSGCVLIYEGRFGYDQILQVEISGSRIAQADLGEFVAKALTRAAGPEGSDSAWARYAPPNRILVRALTYTGNPKLEDEKTRYARFAGAYDRKTKKWIASETHRMKEMGTLSSGYAAQHGEDVFMAPGGDQTKVPPEFVGVVVNSEEGKEEHLDEEMNAVYKAIQLVLSPAKFAKVKADQIAWLKKRDSIPAGQRSDLIIARIKALEEFLW
jgi:hypothetical protein